MKRLIGLIFLGGALLIFSSGCRIITNYHYNKVQQKAPFDVIIVPGYPYYEEAKRLNMIQRLRLLWANYLMQQGIATNVIFSGGAVHTPYVEAEIMAQYARSIGIPAEHIFVETRAEHSTENLFYGYAKARELGFKHIAVATDPFQAQLIRRNIKQDSLDVDFIEAKATWIIFKYKKLNPSLEDPCLAYVEDFVPLVKRISKEDLKKVRKAKGFAANMD